MTVQQGARAMVDALVSVIWAPACAACREPLEAPSAGVVCAGCWGSIAWIRPPVCESCGEPLPSWRTISADASRCARCRRRGSRIARAAAVGAYEGALRDIVHALKYDRRRSLAAPLAALMRQHGSGVLDGADACVPVPLHWARRQTRGFNQASELAGHLGIPRLEALARRRYTTTQTELPEARRHANVRGAFRVRPGVAVANLVIVLVDDVSTTGATLEACAAALREAGAREVRALTAAKAVSRRP